MKNAPNAIRPENINTIGILIATSVHTVASTEISIMTGKAIVKSVKSVVQHVQIITIGVLIVSCVPNVESRA